MHPIIDTHTHFYDPTRPQGVPWPRREDKLLYRTVLPADCKVLAAPEGVTGTVVVEASPWLEDNQWILDLADDEPFLVGLVGHIDPGRAEFANDLARFAADPRFCGIRCGGGSLETITPHLLRDLELLQARDRQLDVLIGAVHVPALLEVATRLPNLRIVVDHICSMPVTGEAVEPAWLTRYQQLAEQPNITMKVSGLLENSVIRPAPTQLDYYRPTLDALWESFGAERLLYGSNWPVCEVAGSYATCIDLVRRYFAEKGQAASECFFWRNAKRIYRYKS